MNFHTVCNQIGNMAVNYGNSIAKPAAKIFAFATFASLSANWLLPAIQIRHFCHSKKITAILASTTALFLAIYKMLNKENKKEEVTAKYQTIRYNEEETKKYIETSPGMNTLHKEMLEGADLEKLPSLTQFVIKETTLTILNYTDKKTGFTENRSLWIDNSFTTPSFDSSDCELIIYQLMGDDNTIFIEQKDVDSKYCAAPLILPLKGFVVDSSDIIKLTDPIEVVSALSLKPITYTISKIDETIKFKMIAENKEIDCQNINFKPSQLNGINITISNSESKSFTYIDYTQEGVSLLPFLLEDVTKGYLCTLIMELTAYPGREAKTYYRKVKCLDDDGIEEEKVVCLSKTYGSIKPRGYFDNRDAIRKLMCKNNAQHYFFLKQFEQLHGIPQEVLQIISSLFYNALIL